MAESVFLDTNVLLYSIGQDNTRTPIAEGLLEAGGIISVQVLDVSIYDALIMAAAIDAGCTLLYSEDLQDGQVIEGRLTIRNPFAGSQGR